MMKYIEITKIQAFPIPEKLTVLVDNNNVLKIANETLSEKNDTLQKLVIVSLIIIPILGFVIYQKNQLTKNQNKK
jgi:hypothetical protein